jgi:enoyl-CoA hydratase
MTVTVTVEERIGVVTIDRPEVRNAVDPDSARRLHRAALDLDRDPAVDAIVLTGSGGTFCSGFDLGALASGTAEPWLEEVDIPGGWNDPVSVPLPSPMGPCRLVLTTPTIAAIEGHAVAGGLELAAWCHLRVAAEDATLGVFCRRWGVPLIDGGTIRLPAIIGRGRACDLILTGRPVDAVEALGMGLVDRICPPGSARDVAIALAREIAGFPGACVRADLVSTHGDPTMLAHALTREWRSTSVLAEATAGAQRFVDGGSR